jgi:predicted nucleic acid-binding Zn ribbon protein
VPADGGPAGPGPDDRARLAAEALAQARADAQARGAGVAARGRRRGQPPGPARMPVHPGDGAGADAPAAGSGDEPPAGAAGESRVSGLSAANPAEAGAAGAGSPAAAPGRAGRARASRPRRARRDDPEPLRAAIGGLLDARGWRADLAVGGLFGRWDQIVGAELAAHTRPEAFTDGELLVTADSTTWATQVRLLAATLVARVNAELGGPVVRRVKVRGPAPPPPSGPWRVRGSRGPRGDYG